MVIGEVLTFNKPCVVTNVGGTMEYFDEAETAEAAEQNTDECIACAVMKLLTDKDHCNKLKDNISSMHLVDYTNEFSELIEGA